MPAFSVLCLALTIACISGVNLYLTILLTGTAGQFGWLPAEAGALVAVVAHPAVITVAALLCVLNAIIDRIPSVNSLWDALHTVIRPAGAVLMVLAMMRGAGDFHMVACGVLAAAVSLTMHFAKSAVRLRINHGGGPAGHIAMSTAEDALVAGLFFLTVYRQTEGAMASLALLAVCWLCFARLFRMARAGVFFHWRKLRNPAGESPAAASLSGALTAEQELLLHTVFPEPAAVEWVARCVTGKVRCHRHLKRDVFGTLVKLAGHPDMLVFIGTRWFRQEAIRIDLTGSDVRTEGTFLSEDLIVSHKRAQRLAAFQFPRGTADLVIRLAGGLQHRHISTVPPPVEAAPAPVAPIREAVIVESINEPSPVFPPFGAPVIAAPVEESTITPFPEASMPAGPAPLRPIIPPIDDPPMAADVPPMPEPDRRPTAVV